MLNNKTILITENWINSRNLQAGFGEYNLKKLSYTPEMNKQFLMQGKFREHYKKLRYFIGVSG